MLEEIKNISQDLLISKVKDLKKNINHIEPMIEKGECTELVFVNDDKVIGK